MDVDAFPLSDDRIRSTLGLLMMARGRSSLRLDLRRCVLASTLATSLLLISASLSAWATPAKLVPARGPLSGDPAANRGVTNLTRGIRIGGPHSAIAQSKSNPKVLYLATGRGRIHTSRDGGQSWSESVAITHRGRFFGSIRNAGSMSGILDRWLTPTPISFGRMFRLRCVGGARNGVTGMTGQCDETAALQVGGDLTPRSGVSTELTGLETNERSYVRGSAFRLLSGLVLPTDGGGGGGGGGGGSSLAVGLKAKAPWLAYQVRRKRRWAIGITLQQSLVLKAGAATWINHLSIHPNDPNDVLAATEDGLLRSRDGGYSWPLVLTGATSPERDMNFVIRHPQRNQTIYAATRQGLKRSTDDGDTFQPMLHRHVSASNVRWISFDPKQPRTFYVGLTSGLVKTTDAGQNFALVFRSPWPALRRVRQVEVDPFDSQRVWLGTADGLLVSRDAGGRFDRAGGLLFTGKRIKRIAFGTTPGHVIVGTIRDLWETRDGGQTWQIAYFGPIQWDVRNLISDRENTGSFLIATTAEILRFGPVKRKPVSRRSVAAYRRRVREEPPITMVLQKALKRAGLFRPDLMKYRTNARFIGLMPSIVATGRWGWYDGTTDFSVNTFTTRDLPILRNSNTQPFMASVYASWELARIIFTSRETIGRRVGRANLRAEGELTRTVIALFQERLRLLFEVMTQKDGPRMTLLRRIRLEELTAHLNALTGNLFEPVQAL